MVSRRLRVQPMPLRRSWAGALPGAGVNAGASVTRALFVLSPAVSGSHERWHGTSRGPMRLVAGRGRNPRPATRVCSFTGVSRQKSEPPVMKLFTERYARGRLLFAAIALGVLQNPYVEDRDGRHHFFA